MVDVWPSPKSHSHSDGAKRLRSVNWVESPGKRKVRETLKSTSGGSSVNMTLSNPMVSLPLMNSTVMMSSVTFCIRELQDPLSMIQSSSLRKNEKVFHRANASVISAGRSTRAVSDGPLILTK